MLTGSYRADKPDQRSGLIRAADVGCDEYVLSFMSCGIDYVFAALEACAIAEPQDDVSAGDWWLQMTGSLVGAAVGAVCAYLGQRRFSELQDRRAFRARRDEAADELERLANETAHRAGRDGNAINLDALLPVGAWNRFLDGGHRDRLPDLVAAELERFYGDVYGANAAAGQLGALLQVSMLAPDPDQRQAFRKQLAKLVSEPYAGLPARATDLAAKLRAVNR